MELSELCALQEFLVGCGLKGDLFFELLIDMFCSSYVLGHYAERFIFLWLLRYTK